MSNIPSTPTPAGGSLPTAGGPLSILYQYMRQPGVGAMDALALAAQAHPEAFPPQRVQLAKNLLRRPELDRRKALESMARERGIDLDAYIADLQQQAARAK